MDFTLIGESDVLAALCRELSDSPEELMLALEEHLERGTLTVDEVAQYLKDMSASSR